MKNIRCILVFLLSCTTGFTQENIDLKTVPFEIQDQNIYIEKVFDDRQEQHLGVVKDRSGKQLNLRLEEGASVAVKKFMDVALPKTDNRTPIHIRIKALEIQQVQTSIDEITARVYTKLSFFSEGGLTGGELFSIGHYENQVFPVSNSTEIYETHEKRIRAALEYCIRGFINSQNTDTTDFTLEKNKGTTVDFSTGKSSLKPYVPLGKWFNLVTFKRVFDKNNEGWEISYIGFADSEKDFIVPFEISYGQFRAKSDLVRNRGYSSVDSYAFGPGFNGYIKIIPGVYADIGLNIPIGMEVLRDLENKKSNNFLIGIGANQGIKIIPWKEFGIVIGAGIFQQLQTSKVYKRNFGFELELGINF